MALTRSKDGQAHEVCYLATAAYSRRKKTYSEARVTAAYYSGVIQFRLLCAKKLMPYSPALPDSIFPRKWEVTKGSL
jgi:hypothetical protein